MEFGRISKEDVFQISLLSLMLLTLCIPSNIVPISPWNGTPLLIFVRAFFWLVGLSILPGLYILRLVRVGENLQGIVKLAIVTNLSLVIVCLIALIAFCLGIDVAYSPWMNLCFLWFLFFACRISSVSSTSVKHLLDLRFRASALSICTGAAVLLALFVQIGQKYLIPGDVWVALNPAIQTMQRHEYNAFAGRYPVMFGFFLGNISACIGLPIANSFVVLFPLVALNIISFSSMLRTVFAASNRVTRLGAIIYTFGGGFAWLLNTLLYNGTQTLSNLSRLTEDIYFSMTFWNTMEFSHRTLALTLAYVSVVVFVIFVRAENNTPRKALMLGVSSLLMLFSFMIHMLEALVFVPLIFIVAFAYHKGKARFIVFGLFLVSTLVIGGLIDFMMSGYYTWLAFEKLSVFLSSISLERLIVCVFLLVVGSFMLVLGRRLLRARSKSFLISEAKFSRIKLVAAGCLMILYVLGLCHFAIAPIESSSQQTSYLTSSFPWYMYVTRYGLVGIFALLGIAMVSWKENWFKIAASWSILIIILSNVWWGTRINAYLFPMLALLAAVGVSGLWRRAGNTVYITITTAKSKAGKNVKLNLKPIMAAALITTVGLSFTSLLYGASYYMVSGPSLSDDVVDALLWINKNTPQSAAILVPNRYNIYKSVSTIADRRIYLDTNLLTTVDAASFTNLTYTLQTNSIQYALTTASISQQNYMVDLLIAYSTLAFQAGENRIYKLPQLTPPTPNSDLAVVDKVTLGLPDTTNFAWLDDSFTSNWTYKSVNATSDGEVITYEWIFHTNSTQEPSMKAKIVPKNTNAYPYLIINYRNTLETTTTAENNVGQIVTLINSTGYPKGFFKNIYLPISRQNTFSIFTTKLPENQEVAEIWIWMRNYEKLNGTVGLQIDYMGLSSDENIPQNPTNTRFIASIIPSMWQTNYSIFQEYDQVQGAKTIVTTYCKDIYNKVLERTDTSIFVLFNRTITLPSWGIGWQNVDANVATGYVDNKKIILCRTEGINQENIAAVAENIYQQIQD